MTYIISFLDNNGKLDIYTGGGIHGLYHYLEIIGSTSNLTSSDHIYSYFGTTSSTNNDIANLRPVVSDLHVWQNIVCELCGRIGHKDDTWIIIVPNFFPLSPKIKMNQFNIFNVNEQTKPPWYWNIQPPSVQFKSRSSPPKTSPVFSSIIGELNNRAVDNGDVEV